MEEKLHTGCLTAALALAVGGPITGNYLEQDAKSGFTEHAKKAFELENQISMIEHSEYKLNEFDRHTTDIEGYNSRKDELALLMQEPETAASISAYNERRKELFPLVLASGLGLGYGLVTLLVTSSRRDKKK